MNERDNYRQQPRVDPLSTSINSRSGETKLTDSLERLQKYENRHSFLSVRFERYKEWKRRTRSALAGIVLYGGLLTGSNAAEIAFASESNTSSFIEQYTEWGKQASRTKPLEDFALLANGKDITSQIDIIKSPDSVSFRKDFILALITKEGKAIDFIHTHTINCEALLRSLESFKDKLSTEYPDENFMNSQECEYALQQARSGNSEYNSTAPGGMDINTSFIISYIEKKSDVPINPDYVFDGSGMWSYSIDFEHPSWIHMQKLIKDTQIPQNDEEYSYFYWRIWYANESFFRGYQMEVSRLLTKEVGLGLTSKSEMIQDIIKKVRDKYGVILDYKTYEEIENKAGN